MVKHLYIPRKESECSTYYSVTDRPGNDTVMFYNDANSTYAHAWTDHATGNTVNFGQTLSGSDRRISNPTHIWRKTSGYARFGAYTIGDDWTSVHIGAMTPVHPAASIIGYSQHLLPSYIGVRFQYRWPYDNNVNYWSNSPTSINDMMLHYYNGNNGEFWSYSAGLVHASQTNSDFWPDRFVSNNGRRSDSWLGCYWKPLDGSARSEIRNNQLFMIGVSFEMKFHDRGTAKHSRCMDLRNFTPIYDRGGEQKHRPILAKPKSSPWATGSTSKHELYLI